MGSNNKVKHESKIRNFLLVSLCLIFGFSISGCSSVSLTASEVSGTWSYDSNKSMYPLSSGGSIELRVDGSVVVKGVSKGVFISAVGDELVESDSGKWGIESDRPNKSGDTVSLTIDLPSGRILTTLFLEKEGDNLYLYSSIDLDRGYFYYFKKNS